jgi:16S rRNA (adenine1518-N6/adenine1519-N6)-dimethyltransferase
MYARHMKARPKTNQEELAGDKLEKFAHKRSLGQNFLTSEVVPNWMADAANINPLEVILEIGPGTGMLTKVLLARGAKVVAIEADLRAIELILQTFSNEIASGQLTIHHGDAREITPQTLGLKTGEFKVVANIPYYLSGFLLRLLLENPIQPSSLTFLIQKELAARIARDKKESLLSLSVKAFGQPHYQKTVSKGHFFPKPKVDSAIITISNINNQNFKTITPQLFFEILHLGLGKKRKQLLTNLTEKYSRQALQNIFTNLSLSPTIRGEDVHLETWLSLVEKLKQEST